MAIAGYPQTAAPVGPERGAIPAKAGIGLRFPHHATVPETRPDIAWFEARTENYMRGGKPIAYLGAIRAHGWDGALYAVRAAIAA